MVAAQNMVRTLLVTDNSRNIIGATSSYLKALRKLCYSQQMNVAAEVIYLSNQGQCERRSYVAI